MDQMGLRAMQMLQVALRGEGKAKGLIVLSRAQGGATWARIGDTEETLTGTHEERAWESFYELLDRSLIVETAPDGIPAGHIVTPLGYDVAAEAEMFRGLNRNLSSRYDVSDLPELIAHRVGVVPRRDSESVLWVELSTNSDSEPLVELVAIRVDPRRALRLSQSILNEALDLIPSLPPFEDSQP